MIRIGTVVDVGSAAYDWFQGGEDRNERLGGAAGELLAGSTAAWGTALVVGSFTGPWTTAAMAVAAMYFAGKAGRSVGSEIGGSFDSGGGR